tara:strand:- start:4500 stop:4928 length:429 start_codon:yes stop_codon:yes gene_type:complete
MRPKNMTTTKKTSSDKSSQEDNLFAIAEASGKQFLLKVNRYYDLDRINAKEKEKIILDKILLIQNKDDITVGKPYIQDAKIELEVISHRRDRKIIVYKMRPKKKTRRKSGHRQELTRVMVKSITVNKAASKTASSKTTKSPK